mgnify:CR=1 FL=1
MGVEDGQSAEFRRNVKSYITWSAVECVPGYYITTNWTDVGSI